MSKQNDLALQPVVLGGDIGAYSLARAFHEGYGVKSIVVSGVSTGLLRHSRILRHITEPNIDDSKAVIQRLLDIAADNKDKDLIVVASADWLVGVLVHNAEKLRQAGYTVPYVGAELFDRLTDKEAFGELCEQLGIPHPATVVYECAPIVEATAVGVSTVGRDASCSTNELSAPSKGAAALASEQAAQAGLRYPLIAKAASSAQWHTISFDGQKKVHTVATPAELDDLIGKVKDAGYTGAMILQDYIPGDDSGMRILTCYSDQTGKVRFSAYGHVLLEEHAPGALGNPAAIITETNKEVVANATKLLEHTGWTGISNFDIKYDPRDGSYVFFELNPRLGRSNFYITAAGTNPVKFYVEELMRGQDAEPLAVLGVSAPVSRAGELVKEHLYTVLPGQLLLQYLFDPKLRKRTRKLLRKHHYSSPLWYWPVERNPRRLAYIAISQLNHWRKYRRWYPITEAKARWEAGVLGG